jgi:hypothetical protein
MCDDEHDHEHTRGGAPGHGPGAEAARRERYKKHRFTEAQIAALAVDEAAFKVSRCWGVYDLALGETILELFRCTKLVSLGPATQEDFARETLGVKPRTMKDWMRLARGLKERPVPRKAVAAGLVSPRKAMTVFPLAIGEEEATWTAAAVELSLKDLANAVRAEGKEVEGEPEGRSCWVPLVGEDHEVVEAACLAVELVEGTPLPKYTKLEMIAREGLGGLGAWLAAPKAQEEEGPSKRELDAARRAWRKAVRGQRGGRCSSASSARSRRPSSWSRS